MEKQEILSKLIYYHYHKLLSYYMYINRYCKFVNKFGVSELHDTQIYLCKLSERYYFIEFKTMGTEFICE